MFVKVVSLTSILAHSRYNTFDFIRDLSHGDRGAILLLAGLFGFFAFCSYYNRITGKSFVKSKKERREARKRRYHVLWEYERDR